MPLSDERVLEIFKGLENGDGYTFFEHVADDVDWTVMGTHPSPATISAGKHSEKQSLPS